MTPRKWYLSGAVVAIVVIVALILIVFRINGSDTLANENGTQTAQEIQEEEDDTVEVGPVGELLTVQQLPENVTIPGTPEAKKAVKLFGEASVRSAIAWSEAMSFQTSFDPSIWFHEEGKPAVSPQTTMLYLPYFTPSGKEIWHDRASTQALIDANLDAFFLAPAAGTTFNDIPQRPNLNTYTINNVSVGPKSSYNRKPTLIVDVTDYHVYDWTYEGKPVSEETGRRTVYTLSETNNPKQPWLINDFTSELLPSKTAEPRAAE